MNNQELAHYGVLGMKWGKRKAQRKEAEEKIKKMSDKELKSKIERIRLEKQYKELTTKKKAKGRKMVERNLERHGDKVMGAALAWATAYGVKKVAKHMAKRAVGA